MNTPLVSVVIPTYNREHLITRAIESVLKQTFQDFEVIVVDDASSDNTEEVVGSFNDERIQYLRHEKNKGGAAARNTGIEASKGEFVAFLDSDDEWLPNKLKAQLKYFSNKKNSIGVVYCKSYTFDGNIGILQKTDNITYNGNINRELLKGWCPSTTSLFLVKREVIFMAGLFDETLPSFQDYDLWIRLSQICHFRAVEEPLIVKHSHQGTQITSNPTARADGLRIFMSKWERVIKKEVGPNAAHKVRSKFLKNIYLETFLKKMEEGHRIEAITYMRKYTHTGEENSILRTLALFATLIFGISAYSYLRRTWGKIKWNSTKSLKKANS